MPRKPCYWTRKLELQLIDFVHQRDFVWKPVGNTNHDIQKKYRAYAEFAAKLGRGFTARSVRDRWVNIRSTFNHNLRRVEKSMKVAKSSAEIYVPCWPLWKPLQFLKEISKKEPNNIENFTTAENYSEEINDAIKRECAVNNDLEIKIRQRSQRSDRPRRKKVKTLNKNGSKCMRIIDDLVKAVNPLANAVGKTEDERYWFFGKHVTEQLNTMRTNDAECACQEIMTLLDEWPLCDDP
ncbi:uncharacterized protein LOC101744637 [Bombyx mori]|uniref:MADF domain-containing protein n=1 Tax=Bombyx mori TaxID=7091 RepID=A0A8R2HR14_BOMMO|nr:uncharacterized protein LOC101744637 [Bombyx mori]XP_037871380.1 uncharacterized protein LOC101744637 [Bombyx mori]